MFTQIIVFVAIATLLVVLILRILRPRKKILSKYGPEQPICRCGIWHSGMLNEGWLIIKQDSLILEPYFFGAPLRVSQQDIVSCQKGFLGGVHIKTINDGTYSLTGIGINKLLSKSGFSVV